MILENLIRFYKSHRGGVNGALIGFLIATMILLLGFLKVLFIAVCAGIGYYVGKKLTDDREYIKNLLDRILPPGTYR